MSRDLVRSYLIRPCGVLTRFRKEAKGATAIEFGLLAMPFFMMFMMIVESSMLFWTRQLLQEATSQAARTILTGESRNVYTGTTTEQTAKFRDAICENMKLGSDCATRLFVDVQPMGTSFPPNMAESMISGNKINPANFKMRPVAPSEVAVVRVALKMPVLVQGFFGTMAVLEDGSNVLQAVVAFQAEPYVL
jgi:Flp pilus assembly protein TadG